MKRDAHEAFDPPFTTVNVGLVAGGTAKNVIAGECRFTLEWRPVPGQRPDAVAELVRREIEDLRAEDSDFDCELSVTRLDGGMETDAQGHFDAANIHRQAQDKHAAAMMNEGMELETSANARFRKLANMRKKPR